MPPTSPVSRTIWSPATSRPAAGSLSDRPGGRPQLVDEFLPKLEEWIERSKGKLRADRAHEKLAALGYTGSERTTRRAVAAVKRDYRLGRVRVHRPWMTEPGMWLQYDFGDSPVIDGVKNDAVRCLAGLVAVPGGSSDPGQDRTVGDGRPRRDAASPGWRAHVPAAGKCSAEHFRSSVCQGIHGRRLRAGAACEDAARSSVDGREAVMHELNLHGSG